MMANVINNNSLLAKVRYMQWIGKDSNKDTNKQTNVTTEQCFNNELRNNETFTF